MTATDRIAITGASGFIGGTLLARLAGRQPVRALSRTRAAATRSRDHEIVIGDLDSDEALQALVRHADIVFHCAAHMGKGDRALSHRVNVLGTERLVRAAAAAGVRRFVYVSSISVFGATRPPDGVITEGDIPAHLDRLNAYASTKYQGELIVRHVARKTGLPWTILRPTNVYGPGSGPWFRQFEQLLARVPVAFGDLPIDLVYVDDLLDAMVGAARSPAAANGTFHIGHEMVARRDFVAEIGRVTGRRARRLPRPVDRALRFLIDRGYRVATGTNMSLSLRHAVRYPHDLAREVFGYAPRLPLAAGIARLMQWYRPATPAVVTAA